MSLARSIGCLLSLGVVLTAATHARAQGAPPAPGPAPAEEAPTAPPAELTLDSEPESEGAPEVPAENAGDAAPADSEADIEEDDEPIVVAAPEPRSPFPTPTPAPAAGDPVKDSAQEALPPAPEGELGSYQKHWYGSLGARTSFIRGGGYDPFSTDDVLSQLSISLGRTVWTDDQLSVALMASWDVGGVTATARGQDTALSVHRLTLGPEVRYHLVPWLYGFARVAPGALYSSASLDEEASNTTLYARSWQFAVDGTAGLAVQVIGKSHPLARSPRGWIVAEAGYGWASASDTNLGVEPDDDIAPARTEDVAFPELAMRGATVRISAAMTF